MHSRLWMVVAFLSATVSAGAAGVEIVATVKDAGGSPIADAIVFVPDAKGKTYKPPRKPYVMDQLNKELEPRVLPIQVGGKVSFPNSDNVQHHLYSFSAAKNFELPLYSGQQADPVTFDKPGVVVLGCNIHDWMSGYILVVPTPYFARTDSRGRARLKIPAAASVQLAVFHERLVGSVDKTIQDLSPGSQAKIRAQWELSLKPPSKRRRFEAGDQ